MSCGSRLHPHPGRWQLSEKGIEDNERNLRNKVSRGKFTAGFLLQCLSALGVKGLPLEAVVIEDGPGPLILPWHELNMRDTIGRWAGNVPGGSGRKITLRLAGQNADIGRAFCPPFGTPTHEFYVFGLIRYRTFFDDVYLSQFCFGRRGLPAREMVVTSSSEDRGVTVNISREVPIPLPRPTIDLVTYEQVDE